MFNSKRGLGGGPGGGPRKPISLIMGLVFVALGIIPLLNSFNVIGFSLPYTPSGIVLYVISTIAGVLLLLDAFAEKMGVAGGLEGAMRNASRIFALVFLIFGIIPLLGEFGVVPFTLPAIGGIILEVLFVIAGIVLLYGGTRSI